MKNLEKLLLPLILEAGKIMTGARDIEGAVSEKGGDAANMVTVFDVAVQNFLMTEITKIIPDAFFFAEEKENNAEDLMRDYCFVIDPIDGTTNFVHDYRYSCISVAMFSHGDIKFAAVYDPYADEMFSATKGGGAFFGKVGSFDLGYEFDAVVMDDSVIPHPQSLNLAERMERAVYLGLDEKNITAKFVAGRKIL